MQGLKAGLPVYYVDPETHEKQIGFITKPLRDETGKFVKDNQCMLSVIVPGSTTLKPIIAGHDENQHPGTWHWLDEEVTNNATTEENDPARKINIHTNPPSVDVE